MASTGYKSTGAKLTLSGYTYGMDGRVNYNNPTRTNNTVYFTGVSATARYTGPSGGSFSWNAGWDIQAEVPSGTARSSGHWSGGRSVGNTNTTGTQSFNFTVGANANSINVRVRGKYRNDGWSYTTNTSITIPALGAPSGTTKMDAGSASHNQLGVRNDVTNWGTSATAGSVRSYIADNSSWSGQTYKGTSDDALVIHTGLTSNKRYWFRGWAQNGGGKNNYLGTANAYTLPVSCVAGTPDIEAVSATIPVTQDSGGGAYTITKQYRLLKTGDDWGEWTTFSTDIELTGLLPSTEYQVQVRSTTSAGTTTGDTTTLTTLPAAKLVMPDGTVKNAIPRLVHPDGTVEMVKVNHV